MNIETEKEIVSNAIRWTSNILVEVLSNHGRVSDEGRAHLKEAIKKLAEASWEYRK